MFYVDRLLTFRSLLIAARPGMGKTTLALCLADAFRTASGKDALIFMPTVCAMGAESRRNSLAGAFSGACVRADNKAHRTYRP